MLACHVFYSVHTLAHSQDELQVATLMSIRQMVPMCPKFFGEVGIAWSKILAKRMGAGSWRRRHRTRAWSSSRRLVHVHRRVALHGLLGGLLPVPNDAGAAEEQKPKERTCIRTRQPLSPRTRAERKAPTERPYMFSRHWSKHDSVALLGNARLNLRSNGPSAASEGRIPDLCLPTLGNGSISATPMHSPSCLCLNGA